MAKLLDLNSHYDFGKFHEFNHSESVGYIILESRVDAFLSANNLLLLAWSSGLPWFNTPWSVSRSHCFTSPAGLDKDGL